MNISPPSIPNGANIQINYEEDEMLISGSHNASNASVDFDDYLLKDSVIHLMASKYEAKKSLCSCVKGREDLIIVIVALFFYWSIASAFVWLPFISKCCNVTTTVHLHNNATNSLADSDYATCRSRSFAAMVSEYMSIIFLIGHCLQFFIIFILDLYLSRVYYRRREAGYLQLCTALISLRHAPFYSQACFGALLGLLVAFVDKFCASDCFTTSCFKSLSAQHLFLIICMLEAVCVSLVALRYIHMVCKLARKEPDLAHEDALRGIAITRNTSMALFSAQQLRLFESPSGISSVSTSHNQHMVDLVYFLKQRNQLFAEQILQLCDELKELRSTVVS